MRRETDRIEIKDNKSGEVDSVVHIGRNDYSDLVVIQILAKGLRGKTLTTSIYIDEDDIQRIIDSLESFKS